MFENLTFRKTDSNINNKMDIELNTDRYKTISLLDHKIVRHIKFLIIPNNAIIE